MCNTMIHKLSKVWSDLNRSIYTGKRLKDNLKALTAVSVFTMLLGLLLVIMNLVQQNYSMLGPSLGTFIGGASCAFLSGILKKREIAILIPVFFCAIAFTYYSFTGAGEGTAILWSMLMPIGLCYFVSVKYGILLSIYYMILFCVLFYTPLNKLITEYYSEAFIVRFPILYASMAGFTAIAMVQYHRSNLMEMDYAKRLSREVRKQTAVANERARRIEQMSFQTIQTLAYAIDAKDPYTRGHSTRVSAYSVKIAEALGWDGERINDLRYAALLHDIGKIGVPDSILNNPKRLTDVEYDIIKSHTTMGEEILKNRVFIHAADDVALSHHERYDGKGYPRGIRGEEISEEARIVAVCDAFDAMSSNRVYRKACDYDHIRSELETGRGTQFDPDMVDVFIKLWDSGELDDIMGVENLESGENMEASSALLQEVVETFTSQNNDEIDVTTGVMSRNTGEAAVAQAMMDTAGCFVFFDLDNLKTINDTNGHEAGDRFLRNMGDTLMDNSKDGICCRLGGDEFIMFLKGVTKAAAEKRIQAIMDEFEEKKAGDAALFVGSLSAGAVMTSGDELYEDVYNKADTALYHIKQSGKNSYAFYSEELDDAIGEQVDVGKMVHALRDSGSYEGALDVEYRQFTKLYEFVGKLEKRFSHEFRLIMISLESSGDDADDKDIEKAMYFMEQSILQTIRDVDVLTRYNRHQFLVILLGTDLDGVKIAVDRIFRGYYKMHGSGGLKPSYTIVEGDLKEE